ncbi:hypothetical protein BGX28_001852 [Mortierella sp. GBA30]|nr:hypothetical protein BGX28_001852 [Mortierella sp. GBA30]
MPATEIPSSIGINEVVGLTLVGASMMLTLHSLIRMYFMRRTASKYHLFAIVNFAQFVNQWSTFCLVTAAINVVSFNSAIWLNVVNNFAYFISKPSMMYLAYLRCSAVYPAYTKADILHYFLIMLRAVELMGIVVVNILQNVMCHGSSSPGTRCERMEFAWTVQDALAPVFRLYYILCEGIFYIVLFRTLQGMTAGYENTALLRYRRLQTTMFTLDLMMLVSMSIYRIFIIFFHLPTYVYLELFSSTLTIFNLTEFGLSIRVLFNAVTEAKISNSSDPCTPSRVELGSVSAFGPRRPMSNGGPLTSTSACRSNFNFNSNGKIRPQIHDISSPLTSFAAETGYSSNSSECDPATTTIAMASSRHQSTSSQPTTTIKDEYLDYIPYCPPKSLSPSPRQSNNNSIQWSPSSYSSPTSVSSPTMHQDNHIMTSAVLAPASSYPNHALHSSGSFDVTHNENVDTNAQHITRPDRMFVPSERTSSRRRRDDLHY